MGPLQFLAPLAVLSSAASAASAAVGALLIVAVIGTPLALALLHTPLPTGLWRAPWAWCLFPLTAMVVCSEALRGGFTEGVLFPLGVLCAWLVVALLAAVPRLLFRVVRFSLTGKPSNVRGWVDRALGVLGRRGARRCRCAGGLAAGDAGARRCGRGVVALVAARCT